MSIATCIFAAAQAGASKLYGDAAMVKMLMEPAPPIVYLKFQSLNPRQDLGGALKAFNIFKPHLEFKMCFKSLNVFYGGAGRGVEALQRCRYGQNANGTCGTDRMPETLTPVP